MGEEIKGYFGCFFVEILVIMWKCELSKGWLLVAGCGLLAGVSGVELLVVQWGIFSGVDFLAKGNFYGIECISDVGGQDAGRDYWRGDDQGSRGQHLGPLVRERDNE